jgi:hypothetical protein
MVKCLRRLSPEELDESKIAEGVIRHLKDIRRCRAKSQSSTSHQEAIKAQRARIRDIRRRPRRAT